MQSFKVAAWFWSISRTMGTRCACAHYGTEPDFNRQIRHDFTHATFAQTSYQGAGVKAGVRLTMSFWTLVHILPRILRSLNVMEIPHFFFIPPPFLFTFSSAFLHQTYLKRQNRAAEIYMIDSCHRAHGEHATCDPKGQRVAPIQWN